MSDLHFVSRGFAAGALTFRFRCDSAQTVSIYESIFRDLAHCENPDADIEVSHRQSHAFVRRPGGTHCGVPREDLVPWEVLRQVNLAALDADVERIHVHAAALVLAGRGTMIVAPSGTGKTTTAALLSQLGAVYATDEMLGFGEFDVCSRAFPKPFSVKEDHHESIASIAAMGHQALVGERSLSIVPASLVGAITDSPLNIELIVFLNRTDGDRPYSAEVHSANATAELALQSMDLERAGPAGLGTLAAVAARAACYAVSAGTPQETAALVSSLAESLPSRTEPTAPTPTAETTSSIQWVDFGDAIAFYAQQSGSVGSFHEPAASEWRHSPAKSEQLLNELTAAPPA